MLRKFFGVFFTLICFFGSMLLAFSAEFLMDWEIVCILLIGISLAIFIFGIILCKKRKINLFHFTGRLFQPKLYLLY